MNNELEARLRRVLAEAAGQLDAPAHVFTPVPQRRGPRRLRPGDLVAAVAVLAAVAIAAVALTLHGRRRPAASAAHGPVPAAVVARSRAGLLRAVAAARGRPVVITLWASWCRPCVRELGVVRSAEQREGASVVFVTADVADPRHPSLAVNRGVDLRPLVPARVRYLPATIFVGADGRFVRVRDGEYGSARALEADIARYARSGRRRGR